MLAGQSMYMVNGAVNYQLFNSVWRVLIYNDLLWYNMFQSEFWNLHIESGLMARKQINLFSWVICVCLAIKCSIEKVLTNRISTKLIIKSSHFVFIFLCILFRQTDAGVKKDNVIQEGLQARTIGYPVSTYSGKWFGSRLSRVAFARIILWFNLGPFAYE